MFQVLDSSFQRSKAQPELHRSIKIPRDQFILVHQGVSLDPVGVGSGESGAQGNNLIQVYDGSVKRIHFERQKAPAIECVGKIWVQLNRLVEKLPGLMKAAKVQER